jgi:hypothetical protein
MHIHPDPTADLFDVVEIYLLPCIGAIINAFLKIAFLRVETILV